jgi:hypothetical protein
MDSNSQLFDDNYDDSLKVIPKKEEKKKVTEKEDDEDSLFANNLVLEGSDTPSEDAESSMSAQLGE